MTAITLNQFIKIAERESEASILITENSADITEYTQLLESMGYVYVVDSAEVKKYLNDGKKIYGLVTEKNAEFYYNLANDYGSGDIHLFDHKNKEKIWITPNRQSSAFILIITFKDIEIIKNMGYDFSKITSGAYKK